MSETNVEPTNYLEMIEQLRHDRDKYIGMWRSQCQITEQVMKERDDARASTSLDVIDRLTAELDQVKYDRSVKHDMAAEQIDELTKELDRYKSGVEVEGYVVGVPSDIDANLYFASGWSRELGKLRGEVRVLVMKEEVEG